MADQVAMWSDKIQAATKVIIPATLSMVSAYNATDHLKEIPTSMTIGIHAPDI